MLSTRLATTPSSENSWLTSNGRVAVPDLVLRYPPRRAVVERGGQQAAAILVGEPGGQMAVEPEQVEHHVDHRHLDREPLDLVRVLHVHAALEAFEAGPAGLVERDDLAVEQRIVARQRAAERLELRVARRHLVSVPGPEPHAHRPARVRAPGCRPT